MCRGLREHKLVNSYIGPSGGHRLCKTY